MTKITVKKSYIEYLSRFVHVGRDSRYYLEGIYFDKNELALASTDGHRLGAIKNGFFYEGDFAEYGYIIKFSKEVLSFIKSFKFAEELEITINDDSAVLNICGASMSLELIDSTFPDWRRVCTDESEAIKQIGLNPKLLKDFQIKQFVRLEFSGVTNPIRVIVPELPEFYGLLMPARV